MRNLVIGRPAPTQRAVRIDCVEGVRLVAAFAPRVEIDRAVLGEEGSGYDLAAAIGIARVIRIESDVAPPDLASVFINRVQLPVAPADVEGARHRRPAGPPRCRCTSSLHSG